MKPLSRVLLNILNQKTPLAGCPINKCLQKTTQMTYEKLLVHLTNECLFVKAICHMKCGIRFLKNDWEQHIDRDCIKLEVNCPECNEILYRNQFDPHSCMLIKQPQDLT